MRRHRRHHNYEYEMQYHTPHRHKRHRRPALLALDIVLFCGVMLVPLLGLICWLIGADVPLLHLCSYIAVTQTLAGALFLILTACNVGGFGKVGYFFTHTRGKRWMTTQEAKSNTYLFGGIMLTLGILVGMLSLKMGL